MEQPRLKTFVNPSHTGLEEEFNAWSSEEQKPITVVSADTIYSQALQKYILTVVYQLGK